MKKVVLSTPAQKAKGLIGMSPIPKDTLFIFTDVGQNSYFHSQGVLHPFEIVFVNKDGTQTEVHSLKPPDDTVNVPPWATVAIEAAEGTFPCLKAGDGFRGLGELADSILESKVLLTGTVGVGFLVAWYGWNNSKTLLGAIALGAGASMVGTGIVMLLRELNK
jgi:uncharacterized membrane protein (UPF0127 family)